MEPLSVEALLDRAERVRAVHVAFERAAFVGDPEPLVAVPDPAPLASAYKTLRGVDVRGATMIAEAIACASLRVPRRRYGESWRKEPITLRGEPPIDVRALGSLFALESNAHRRDAIARAADASAHEHLAAARSVVDAWRDVSGRLALDATPVLHAALGFGSPDEQQRAADAVLAATADAFRELDDWVRPRVGVARTGDLNWSERLRTLATPRANERMPLGDRSGIATRWIERIGLGDALARISDRTGSSRHDAFGVRVFAEVPGVRAVLAGALTVAALGTVTLASAAAEGLALTLPSEPRVADRLGADRVHLALASVLARGLFCEPTFLTREASVDRSAREAVLMELLHASLFVMRADAALARFGIDVLARASELPTRFRESFATALATAPPPAWAAHAAVYALDARSGARTLAAFLEPAWRDDLRDAFDEDWFRNPRAGEAVSTRLDAMRAHGTLESFATTPEARAKLFDPSPLARRVAEAMRETRR
jgi:hypothetical protein